MPEELKNQPVKYMITVPGVAHGFTFAHSNSQALAYMIHRRFETSNEFRWNGKLYVGEQGRDQLIQDILNHPGFFDYVKELPGMPSQPLEIPLPQEEQIPQQEQTIQTSLDLDRVVKAALPMLRYASLAEVVDKVGKVYKVSPHDLDAVASALEALSSDDTLASEVLSVEGEDRIKLQFPRRHGPKVTHDPHHQTFKWHRTTPKDPETQIMKEFPLEDFRKEEDDLEAEAADHSLTCPNCGASGPSITPAFGHKLNKCDSCHFAFDGPFEEDDIGFDPEAHQVEADVNRLPTVTLRGREYFDDARLKEFRAVDNPHDRISYDELTGDEGESDEDDIGLEDKTGQLRAICSDCSGPLVYGEMRRCAGCWEDKDAEASKEMKKCMSCGQDADRGAYGLCDKCLSKRGGSDGLMVESDDDEDDALLNPLSHIGNGDYTMDLVAGETDRWIVMYHGAEVGVANSRSEAIELAQEDWDQSYESKDANLDSSDRGTPKKPYIDQGMHLDTEADLDDEGLISCPGCGGPPVHLGELGDRTHFRCRDCGMDFSRKLGANEEGDTGECPMCGGPGVYLGLLGDVDHSKCRDCGVLFEGRSSSDSE